jgi:hypothetical protein
MPFIFAMGRVVRVLFCTTYEAETAKNTEDIVFSFRYHTHFN